MTRTHWLRGAASEARVRMLLVRLLELAALILLLSAVYELWVAWRGPGFRALVSDEEPPVLARVWSVVTDEFRAPIAAVLAGLLLAGALVAIHRLRPLADARMLRAEVGVLVVLGLLLQVAEVAAVAVALVVPYADTLGPSPLGLEGEKASVLLNEAAWPTATLLVYTAIGLGWWLTRREAGDLDEPLTEPQPQPRPQAASEQDEQAPGESDRGMDLAGVERVEPVEPLSPDGSTSNGYDEYFRRG